MLSCLDGSALETSRRPLLDSPNCLATSSSREEPVGPLERRCGGAEQMDLAGHHTRRRILGTRLDPGSTMPMTTPTIFKESSRLWLRYGSVGRIRSCHCHYRILHGGNLLASYTLILWILPGYRLRGNLAQFLWTPRHCPPSSLFIFGEARSPTSGRTG